jgi:hypothetical protein
LYRHADLKIAGVIHSTGKRRDLALGQLGRVSLHADVGKAHSGHGSAELHRATRRHRQGSELALGFEQGKIIASVHLHHLSGDQARAGGQAHLISAFDDMLVGDQKTTIRDEESRAGGFRICSSAAKARHRRARCRSFSRLEISRQPLPLGDLLSC